jgi:hypothetical protein
MKRAAGIFEPNNKNIVQIAMHGYREREQI